MDDALIVFAKHPTPGRVKTRLTPVLSPEEAADLYRAFLLDALDQYLVLEADVRLYVSPDESGTLHLEVPPQVAQFEQVGAKLGDRMCHAFEDTLGANYQRAVIIGTDHPTLPSAFVKQAFAALQDPATISLGPSTDGGYYLLGMNAFYPQLFKDMQYSHGRVFSQTLTRAGKTDAQLTILPPWYDVDEPEDLQRLVEDLGEDADRAPRTRDAIETLGLPALGPT